MAQSRDFSQASSQSPGQAPSHGAAQNPSQPAHGASQNPSQAPAKVNPQVTPQAPAKGATSNPSQAPSKSTSQTPAR